MFDPYHEWLGIPPGPDPPTYYQLLGISREEQSQTVIRQAMLRQSMFVRHFQAGEHAKACARLLHELALAELTLTAPERRACYDAELRRRAAAREPDHVPVKPDSIEDLPPEDNPLFSLSLGGSSEASRPQGSKKPARKSKGAFAKVCTHVVVSVGCLVVIAYFVAKILDHRSRTASRPPVAKGASKPFPKPFREGANWGEDERQAREEWGPKGGDAGRQPDGTPGGKDILPPPVSRGGDWRIEGDELVQNSTAGFAHLEFGESSWSDYDMAFEAMPMSGRNGWYAFFHETGDGRNIFEVGGANNTKHGCMADGKIARPKQSVSGGVVYGKWHPARLEVRGVDYRLLLDGKELFKSSDKRLSKGRIGFATLSTSVRFRNISIRTKDGKYMWEGPPIFSGLPRYPAREGREETPVVDRRPAPPGNLPTTVVASLAQAMPDRRSEGVPSAGLTGKILGGEWKIEGEELVQTSIRPNSFLAFGDAAWSNYDLTCRAKSDRGEEGFLVRFHLANGENYSEVGWGTYGNTRVSLNRTIGGRQEHHWELQRPARIEFGRWYDIKVEVRGNQATSYLDGVRAASGRDARFSRGMVGLGTYNTVVRFRDIAIKSPGANGKVLWQGLPILPGPSNPAQPPRREVTEVVRGDDEDGDQGGPRGFAGVPDRHDDEKAPIPARKGSDAPEPSIDEKVAKLDSMRAIAEKTLEKLRRLSREGGYKDLLDAIEKDISPELKFPFSFSIKLMQESLNQMAKQAATDKRAYARRYSDHVSRWRLYAANTIKSLSRLKDKLGADWQVPLQGAIADIKAMDEEMRRINP